MHSRSNDHPTVFHDGGLPNLDEVVIVHPERGIFVGASAGFTCWSMLDALERNVAATFMGADSAREFVASLASDNDPESYSYVRVDVEPGTFHATVEQLVDAGLEHCLGELRVTVADYGHA